MAGKKVVYLLGAGASAQALPVVSEFSAALQAHAHWVHGHRLNTSKYCDYLNSLAGTITPFGTVDTYARGLYIQGGREKELNELKLHLSLFFLLEQWHAVKNSPELKYTKQFDIDPRYMGWLALMMEKNGKMRAGVNVLSWNYDLQLQYAMSRFMGEKTVIDAQHNEHWFNYPSLEGRPVKQGALPFLVQLNGLAGYLASDANAHWMAIDARAEDVHSRIREWVEPGGGMLIPDSHLSSTVKDSFTFAWEESRIAKDGLAYAKRMISYADVLVVIGYSFPLFNREVDKMLLDAFADPQGRGRLSQESYVTRRLVIQNSNADAGEEFLEAFNWRGLGYPSVQHVKKVQSFHVPYELF